MRFKLADQQDPFGAEREIRNVTTADSNSGSDPVAFWRQEMDGYLACIKEFEDEDPGVIFTSLASYSARMAEIRMITVRSENRRWQSFRTKELEPFLDEIERQFRFFSRSVAVREQELKLSGGGI